MPQKIKVEGTDVNQAIEKGLKKLGLRRDQADVKIIETARKGFLGIGARPAVVEIRQKRWVSADLDSQIYMDVPKKKRSSGRNGRGGNRRNSRTGSVKEIKRGGRRAYAARRREERVPHENEAQLLPSVEIQNAIIPEHIKAPMQQAQDYVSQILQQMEIKAENLHAWWDEKQNRILITLDCDHPAILIGKEGKTLESLQYLATLSISRHFEKPISVVIDTQNYWRRAEDKINADLEYGINQIKKGYSVYRFRPMSAQLRRYIHRAAENNEFVITVSEGEAEYRKVTLRPRPADQPVAKKEEAAVAAPQAEQAQTPAATTEVISEVVAQAAVQTPAAEAVIVQETVTVIPEPAAETVTVVEAPVEQVPAAEQAPVEQTATQSAPTPIAEQTPVEQVPAAEQIPAEQTAPAQTASAPENAENK